MDDSATVDRLLKELVYRRVGYVPAKLPQSVFGWLRETARRERQDPVEMLYRLMSHPEAVLVDTLVEAATVPHTKLFRHREQFDHLRKVLVRLARHGTKPVKVWCAGCATGEEAYSVAACAEEVQVPVQVLGTDVSPAAIRTARLGRYKDGGSGRRPEAGSSSEWVASESLRRMVRFEVASLVGLRPELDQGPFDVIFCRNVLIYFGRAETPTLLERLASYLRYQGAIVVSPADTVLPMPRCLTPGAAVGWLHLAGEQPPESIRVAAPTPTFLPAPPVPPPSPIEQAAGLMSAGELNEAESLLTDLINDDPDHLAGWFLLGEILLQRGEQVQARVAFVRATQCSPRAMQGFDAEALGWAAARRVEALTQQE